MYKQKYVTVYKQQKTRSQQGQHKTSLLAIEIIIGQQSNLKSRFTVPPAFNWVFLEVYRRFHNFVKLLFRG